MTDIIPSAQQIVKYLSWCGILSCVMRVVYAVK